MQGLYLLLVTNKASNILEDLDTLRLLSKVLPDSAGGVDEEAVSQAAFELLFAFDEVISLGYKENVTVAQVGPSANELDAVYVSFLPQNSRLMLTNVSFLLM